MNVRNGRMLAADAAPRAEAPLAPGTAHVGPGSAPLPLDGGRPRARGKFLFVGDEKFWVRGVTYGTFRAAADGTDYPAPEIVERDFAAMARAGLNTLRVYTVPPGWLLDAAASHGLRVMIGLPWEQHVAFLDERSRAADIVARLREGVRRSAGHPAVLCYAIGNEIPAPVVRWYGRRRIERFLETLCETVKAEDPDALVTYVNYPTTEYLDLPFIDLVCFNVYLESKERLAAYLARLQNLAGERPLLMAEIGLDSRRNGEAGQAGVLGWQIATVFEAGCAGALVFAWTDEWHRGGFDIEDWDFGLTTRDRRPKPALATVARAFRNVPLPKDKACPRVSVVVCSYNGSATIGETLAALERLDYPDYEIIVVDDGSKDATGEIAGRHRARLIRTENRGLSAARNTGLQTATGDIVAYIDDDAYPDPDWLTFLAASFMRSDHAGIGGPNIAPPGDGFVADCVANAPGGPVHVLLSDDVAEHIPGCNMAFRRDRLMAIGGFDPQFRVAGDDVDVCWRLQECGWTLGFSPAAVVWHHRRNSLRTYWKQQRGYARAEALLAEKWPSKYNGAGHPTWHGRLYGRGVMQSLFRRTRIYHGTWGSALFQSVYEPALGPISSLALMPEWYFLLAVLGMLSALGVVWPPLLWMLPALLLGVAATFVQAIRGALSASFEHRPRRRLVMRLLIAALHLAQPAARLLGRIQHGLGPWHWDGLFAHPIPRPTVRAIWSERWQPLEACLGAIEGNLKRAGAAVAKGGDFDRWDLTIRGGLFGAVRTMAMVEEHGGGRQMFRLRAWPKVPDVAVGLLAMLALATGAAGADQAWTAVVPLAAGAIGIGVCAYADCALALRFWREAVDEYARSCA